MLPPRRPDRLVVFAPAKINLCLHVGDRRADGFHELESLVVFVDAGDVLQFEPADDLSLANEGPFAEGLSNDDDNLVLKAARLLAKRSNTACGAGISLRKNLPVASGIGGGSADAAAALRGLVRLWELDVPRGDLLAIAAELGSDVPVCIESLPAWMEGRGEKITALPDIPDFWMVLVNPGVSVSTAAVFRKLGRPSHPSLEGGWKNPLDFSTLSRTEGGNIDRASLVRFLTATTNDLETPAREIAPVINEVLAEIACGPGVLLTRMSGSGATCFGIFADGPSAMTASSAIKVKHRDWWVVATKLVRHELIEPRAG